MFELVVTAPFEHKGIAYMRGRKVTDQALVKELLAAQPNAVVKTMMPYAKQVALREAALAAK